MMVDYSIGSSHIGYYGERDAKLKSLGIKVFRYKNGEIMDHLKKVMVDIQDQLYKLAFKNGEDKNSAQEHRIPVSRAGGIGAEMSVSRKDKDLIIGLARYKRQHPTQAEALIWGCLRKEQLGGYKFRRQHIIDSYIVDFYCPTCKLIVEVNAPIHQKQQNYDLSRDINLIALGYKILRFTNDEVLNHTEEVLKEIMNYLQ